MIEGLARVLRAIGVDFDSFAAVFDVGSRDGLQAIELSRLFTEARVVAIECNSETLELCRRNIAHHPRITLVDKAINAYTGRCPFYPIDTARTITSWKDGNPGASSLFRATGAYTEEHYVQNEVEVDCIRLDDLCRGLRIERIDLLWMDLQGAELLALESAGALLSKVRYIYTEVSHRPIYEGQCLFDDVETFLTVRGFRRCTQIDRSKWQQNAIYENTRHLFDAMIPWDPGDGESLDLTIRSIRSCVADVRHIYVLGSKDPQLDGVRFVDARAFPFDVDSIRRVLPSAEWAASYMRQLLKLYFPLVVRHSLDDVLSVDAGTIFLRPCRFIDGRRPIFNFGDDYHAPYFEHMNRLSPTLHRMFAYSGITPTTLLRRAWLDELRSKVEAERAATPFWKAYLEAIDRAHADRGASDCEIYFHFCLLFHASDLAIRRFRWIDEASVKDIDAQTQDYVCLSRSMQQGPTDRSWLEQYDFGTAAEDSAPASP